MRPQSITVRACNRCKRILPRAAFHQYAQGNLSYSCLDCRDARRSRTIGDRFAENVAPANANGCRLWIGPVFTDGYGAFGIGKKTRRAHRVSWELTFGSIPRGMLVCHTCDTPTCVNPAHLFLGTVRDNMHDRDRKGRTCRTRGSARWSARLTEDQVRAIRERRANGETLASLASAFDVSVQNVSLIAHRKTWTHI